MKTLCELCHQQAFVHCPSDSAFLCLDCDAKVHGANFLVARHIRNPLISGDDEQAGSGSDLDSSSSATGKSNTSLTRLPRFPGVAVQVVGTKAEGIFVNWSRKVGADGNAVVPWASHALVCCLGRRTASPPLRVALAASFWFGLRVSETESESESRASTWQEQLTRLEEVSGVPGKQILAAESRLSRALRVGTAPRDLKEGWDESCT